ncbi:MAG: hypothetical protein KF722_13950 [Nitrospira sp.]|nr:hypothetical protein [Nitrospira sp.]
MIGLLLLLVGLVTSFSYPTSSWAVATYAENLKQLADGVTEGTAKLKVGSPPESSQTTP